MSDEQVITIEEETIVEEEIQNIEPVQMGTSDVQNQDGESSQLGGTKIDAIKLESEPNPEPSTSKPKISFGVTMQKKKSVVRTNLLAHKEEDDEPEVEPKRMKLTHFENGMATGDDDETRGTKKKNDYVIPMVVRNDWRIERLKRMEADGTITEEDRAKLAIMLEAQGEAQILAEETIERKVIVVKPEEIEASEDADYSQIPIEQFGLAMLRGCGWKEGEGIGKTNKIAVPLKLPTLRPKGLGLGAQLPKMQVKQPDSTNPEDQIKPLGRGSYVKVIGDTSATKKSKYLNRYGIVKAMDEDTSSCMVELALDRSIVRISQFVLEPVSAREYKKNSKVLNADDYNRVKREQDKQNGHSPSPNIRKTSSKRDLEEYEKTKRVRDDYVTESTSSRMWAVPNLRVRFVDKRYKDGVYFKQKMTVVEAADKYNVELRDEKGKLHYNIKQTWLETVIPKGLGGNVRIVGGPYKGNVGLIAERDDRKERLWVRLLNTDELVKVSFDDACEWVGNEDELF